MKKLFISLLITANAHAVFAQTNPAITEWLQNTTNITGRHYVSGNSTPIVDATLANVQTVKYSASVPSNWVYVTTQGIPSYITGPFLDGNPSIPTGQNAIYKLPLNPVQNTGTLTATTGGNIGIFINGVSLFDYRDGVSWQNSSNSLKGGPLGGTGDGVWNRDAIVAEKAGFDCAKGHPAMGNYHHHQNPSAFNLDINVISTVCNLYLADGLYVIDSTKHSPLIGFAYDGFPFYGAYGYLNANGTGGVVRMKSSYSLRNIPARTTYYNGTIVTPGPPINATYPLGLFKEDYQYNATSPSTPDYLDVHNGRFCVTPEYPNGIYCYFATVGPTWNSVYPYVVGPTYYGIKTTSKVTSITETVTTYLPSVAPLLSITSSATIICSGTIVTFIATATNGGISPIYQWKKNGSNVGINSTSYTNNSLANGDIITCAITTSSAATANSNSVTMIVNTTVTPAVLISASASTICAVTSVSFTAFATNGGTTPSYQWKKNGNNVGSNFNTYSDNALANGDIISCVLTSNETCLTASTANSNTISITVINPVTPLVSISSSATSICAGTLVSFTAVGANGGTTPLYQWKKNGNNVGSNLSSYSENAFANGDIISCMLTSNETCVTAAIANSNTVTMAVSTSVSARPGVISGTQNNLCNVGNQTYSVSSVSNATSYIWTIPANTTLISGQGTNSIILNYSSLFTSGIISVQSTNHCGTSAVRNLSVYAKTTAPGTITGPTSVCANQQTVSYSIAAVTGATSYTWAVPTGSTIKSGKGTALIVVNFGTVAGNITVLAKNACKNSAKSTLPIYINCRMNESDTTVEENILNVTNPFTNQIVLNTKSNVNNALVSLTDMAGQEIYQWQNISLIAYEQTYLSIDKNIPIGIYLINIKNSKINLVSKITHQ